MSGRFVVLVCGGRNFSDAKLIASTLDTIHAERPISLLVHGGAAGADTLADKWALRNLVQTSRYLAEWERYGKKAGPLRNQDMLNFEKPDLVVAFAGGRGTFDMTSRARKQNVSVREIPGASPCGERV